MERVMGMVANKCAGLLELWSYFFTIWKSTIFHLVRHWYAHCCILTNMRRRSILMVVNCNFFDTRPTFGFLNDFSCFGFVKLPELSGLSTSLPSQNSRQSRYLPSSPQILGSHPLPTKRHFEGIRALCAKERSSFARSFAFLGMSVAQNLSE